MYILLDKTQFLKVKLEKINEIQVKEEVIQSLWIKMQKSKSWYRLHIHELSMLEINWMWKEDKFRILQENND